MRAREWDWWLATINLPLYLLMIIQLKSIVIPKLQVIK